MSQNTHSLTDTFVVDADSHWCEHPELFTRLAPAEYKDRVPHVEEKLAKVSPEARVKILGENARRLYRL